MAHNNGHVLIQPIIYVQFSAAHSTGKVLWQKSQGGEETRLYSNKFWYTGNKI